MKILRLMGLAIICSLFFTGCTDSKKNENNSICTPSVMPTSFDIHPCDSEASIIKDEFRINCADGYAANVKKTSIAENQRIIYDVTQEKDKTQVIIQVNPSENVGYDIVIFDIFSQQLQVLISEHQVFDSIHFLDVNLDGYVDIQVYIGGTMNEQKELYVWNPELSLFEKVDFQGFDILSNFEIYDGFLLNWVKGSAYSGTIQHLEWEGNKLVNISEEQYNLKDND